jgi:membrane protease YdiL (CAAX protease family)
MDEPDTQIEPNTSLFSVRDVGLAGLVMLVVNLTAGWTFALFDWSDEYRGLAENLSVQLGLLLGVCMILFRRQLSWQSAFGLHASRFPHSLCIGLLGCALLIPVTFLLHALSQHLLSKWGFPVEDQLAVKWLLENRNPLFRSLLLVQAVILAPICEELFFRGLVLQALRRQYSAPGAIALSAILFAAFHFNLPASLPLFAIASGFAVAYLYSRSLAAAIVMHAAYNLVNFAWVICIKQ